MTEDMERVTAEQREAVRGEHEGPYDGKAREAASESDRTSENAAGERAESAAGAKEKAADAAPEAETKAGEKPAEEDEELNAKYMRLAADFQNYKRRSEAEKSNIYAYANEKIISELLNVTDNFERALAKSEGAGESFVEGMELIFKQLCDVLKKFGLEEMEAEGKEFDPNFHHAVMTEQSEKYESGTVTEVLQKGYLLKGKVIRAAMVKVAG